MFSRGGGDALVLALVLIGCATPPVGYDKPGATDAEQKRDQSACVKISLGSGQPAQIGPATIDREVFARCMEGKGYTPRPR